MCNRRQKGIAQTSVILVLILCVGYGFYLYNLLQVKLKYLDTKALRHQSQQQSLSSQLQAVYEDRARLEKSVQKSKTELEKTREEKELMIQSMLMEYQDKSQALEKEYQELKDKNSDLIEKNKALKLKQDRIYKECEELKQKHAKMFSEHSNAINKTNVKLQNCEFNYEAAGRHREALESHLNEAKGKYKSLQRLLKLIPVNLIDFDHPAIQTLDEKVKRLLIDSLGEENGETAHTKEKILDRNYFDTNTLAQNLKHQAMPSESQGAPKLGENIHNEQRKEAIRKFSPKGDEDEEQNLGKREVPERNGNEGDNLKMHGENLKLHWQQVHDQQSEKERISHQRREGDERLEQIKESHVRGDIEDDTGFDGDEYGNADEDEKENLDDKVERDNKDPNEVVKNTEDGHMEGNFQAGNILDRKPDDSQLDLPQRIQEVHQDPEVVLNPPPAEQDGIDSEEINGQHLYREDGGNDALGYDDGNQQEEGDTGFEENEDDVQGNLNEEDTGVEEEDKADGIGKDEDYANEEENEDEKRLREFRNFKRVMNDKNFMVRNEVQDMIPREANMDKEM